MSKFIGDRTEKSALDEMEEVARQRNADVAEEERLEALRKAKEAERARAPAKPEVIVPLEDAHKSGRASQKMPADYNGVKWELDSPRRQLYTFDKHQERVEALGMRSPLPSEVFSLLADNLEGKFGGELKMVADDIFSGFGEWLGIAQERQGDILNVYIHPKGLVWDKSTYTYVKNNFTYQHMKSFDVRGIPPTQKIDLSRFNDAFVKWFYSRSFKQLPKAMRKGENTAKVYLPPEGVVWPVGRSRFSIDCIFYSNDYMTVASRGVKERK